MNQFHHCDLADNTRVFRPGPHALPPWSEPVKNCIAMESSATIVSSVMALNRKRTSRADQLGLGGVMDSRTGHTACQSQCFYRNIAATHRRLKTEPLLQRITLPTGRPSVTPARGINPAFIPFSYSRPPALPAERDHQSSYAWCGSEQECRQTATI